MKLPKQIMKEMIESIVQILNTCRFMKIYANKKKTDYLFSLNRVSSNINIFLILLPIYEIPWYTHTHTYIVSIVQFSIR